MTGAKAHIFQFRVDSIRLTSTAAAVMITNTKDIHRPLVVELMPRPAR